jgi:hypothetical protein
MKKYVGTKEVLAQPMTAKEAVEKGYKCGKHENEDGYEIEYKDGYKSWSPKEIFEEAYKPFETPFDKIKIEENELCNKLSNLDKFISGDEFNNLGKVSKTIFCAQRQMIHNYLQLLDNRKALMGISIEGTSMVSFAMAIEWLKGGFPIRRRSWNEKKMFVTKQIFIQSKEEASNSDACLIYNENTGIADSWVPSISDIFAEDWEVAININD